MTEVSRTAGPMMIPYFGYRDAALEWLSAAFGFQKTQEFSAPDGKVMHAEMSFGSGAIMIGTGQPPTSGAGEIKGTSPTGHGVYIVVDDVDAHHERAKAAGARIFYGPEDTEFGTRSYRVRDPEGYEWSFGTYRPST